MADIEQHPGVEALGNAVIGEVKAAESLARRWNSLTGAERVIIIGTALGAFLGKDIAEMPQEEQRRLGARVEQAIGAVGQITDTTIRRLRDVWEQIT